jgi:transposase
MTTEERTKTLYVGVDVHKDTHTAVGLSPFGEKLFEITVGNYQKDFAELAKKVEASKGSLSPYFGLEDCHGYGERLAAYLAPRYPLVQVSSVLVERERQKQTHPEKNDSRDAQGVAEVMIRKIDALPAYTLTEEARKAKQLKELSLDREYLVEERTRLKNHLHVLLHRIWNSEYRTVYKDPFALKALKHWLRARPACDPFLLKTMRRKAKRLVDIFHEVVELEKEMRILLDQGGYTIQTASGCGVAVAAMLVGEIGDIARFTSPGALAKYAGCAPHECSSGKTKRWKKTKGGNRRLNCAFHRMALSQISRMGNDKARTYFKRKVSEGKSKSQALVCLRRQMVPIVWMMLKHRTAYRP